MEAKRSSSNTFSSVFKAYFSSGSKYEEHWESSGRRIFSSDEDKTYLVAEPGGRKYDCEYWEGNVSGRRIFASDEDREHWVAEPGIDRKASDFIAKYYATRFTDYHRQYAS
ncbi:unnamed protein product [Sphenostylis stenocarpa]|uniref:Uncharacterized protein n=1 Tax=Sphenostylis stenocarpa TaxID=92480 RepID=A0AA86VP63_9FABA|nr:unnamed protein product [Sphenostylis stenocarpa]